MHIVGQQATVDGPNLGDHGLEFLAEIIDPILAPGPRTEQRVGLRTQGVQAHAFLFGDTGIMHRLLRVGPPKFGDKPLVVRVVGPPRPEFRLDSTAVGRGPINHLFQLIDIQGMRRLPRAMALSISRSAAQPQVGRGRSD